MCEKNVSILYWVGKFDEERRLRLANQSTLKARREHGSVVTAVAGAAAATGAVETTWLIAALAMAHIEGLTGVDTGD